MIRWNGGLDRISWSGSVGAREGAYDYLISYARHMFTLFHRDGDCYKELDQFHSLERAKSGAEIHEADLAVGEAQR